MLFRMRWIVIVALLIAGIWLVGMGAQAFAYAANTVGGPIVSDTTWTAANSPYIVTSNINVFEGVTLTIEPGVTVKMDARTKILVNGGLIVNGTDQSPVIFTSNQPSPAPGDWDKIEFSTTAITTSVTTNGTYLGGSILKGCVVEYAGVRYGVFGAPREPGNPLSPSLAPTADPNRHPEEAVKLQGVMMENCTIQWNANMGVKALARDGSPSWISGSTLRHNQSGAYLDSSSITNTTVISNSTIGGYLVPGIEAYNSQIINNRIIGNSNYMGSYSGLYIVGGLVRGNAISNNRGYKASLYIHGGAYNTITAADNVIIGNIAEGEGYGGGAHVSCYLNNRTLFENNIVANNLITSATGAGAGVLLECGTVLSNTIANNHAQSGAGSGVYMANGEFHYNTVVGNTNLITGTHNGGFQVRGPSSQVHYNTFYGNSPHDVTVSWGYVVSGTMNYWGEASAVNILEQVYDFYDDSARGEFKFIPFLSVPNPDAPVTPPLALGATPQGNGAMQVSWTAVPSFATGWGYKVYYGETNQPPFDGTGQPGGDSPIDVGNQTSIIFSAPLPRFVTITAYDPQGRESWYAQTIRLRKDNQTITFDPLLDKALGDAPFTVQATASSGLAVTFSADGVCTVEDDLVTITATGTCSITAHQAGNSEYEAAPDVTRSFQVTGPSFIYLPFIKR